MWGTKSRMVCLSESKLDESRLPSDEHGSAGTPMEDDERWSDDSGSGASEIGFQGASIVGDQFEDSQSFSGYSKETFYGL